MFILAFAVVITICGTSAATVNGTVNDTNQTSQVCAASDPVISGTVTIKEFDNSPRNLSGAQVIVNSTSGRVLGSTTTDANGHYSISFYSTDTSFIISATYLGCNPISYTVPVTLNDTDGIAYGTRNFQLTPITGTLTSTGYGENVYVKKNGNYNDFAGILTETIPTGSSNTYSAYCIDLYTNIYVNSVLDLNGPLPGTTGDLSPLIDWGKVNYIITHYDPNLNSTANDNEARKIEAAAIQCAIWYFTSVQYGVYPGNSTTGRYQFMTYSPRYNSIWTGPYDGYIQATPYSNSTAVYYRAWQIIDSALSLDYPVTIDMTPETVRIPNGESTTLTVTVISQKGIPMDNITVNLNTTSGSFSPSSSVLSTTVTTNSNGQATLNIYSYNSFNSTATVSAWVQLQKYGTLLYDDPDSPLQNLVVVDQVPLTLRDFSFINFDVTTNVTLRQTVNSPVNVGDTVTYVVTATNNGQNTATGILIRDMLPAGFTATPSSGTSFINGVWIIPNLNNTNPATLTLTGPATAAMAGLWTPNTATITNMEQCNLGTNTTTATSYTKKAAETFTQTVNNVNNTTVNVGDAVTYFITLTNNGPDNATNVKINTTVPSGLTNVTITTSTGTYDGTVWDIGALNSGSTATLNITGKAGSSMAGNNITNIATLTQAEYTPTTTTSTKIYTNKADLNITQTVNTPVNVSDTITYRVTVTNNGPNAANNINIQDIIPANLGNPILSISTGTYNSTTGIWTIPILANLAKATLNITGTATAAMAGILTNNTATITNQTEYDPTPSTNTTGAYTKMADVVVTITTDKPDIRVNTDYVTFTYTVTNYGPDTATNINLTINEPALSNKDRDWNSATTYYRSYTSNPAYWTIYSLASGASETLTIYGKSTTANVYRTGNATITSQTEYDPNPQDTVTNSVWVYNYKANVTITQTVNGVSNATLNVGDRVSYVITVTNNGPDTASGLVITDIIPNGLSNISYLASNGQSTYNTTNGKWTIGNLNNRGTVTLTINGTVTSALAGWNTTNYANRTAQNTAQYNPSPASTNTTFYTNNADVVLTQTINGITGSIPKLNVGDTVTFIVKATNNGPDTATNVNITDIIPLLNNIIITPSNGAGAFNTTTGRWTINSLTSGVYETLNITGTVTAAMAGWETNNTATKTTQTEYDPNTPNTTTEKFYTKLSDPILTQTVNGQNTGILTVNVGDTVTFIIKAYCSGPDNATNIQIKDIIPAGLTDVTVNPSVGTYNQNTGIWTIDFLERYTSITLNITGKAGPTMAGNNITNNALEIYQTEYNPLPGNNTSIIVYTKKAEVNVDMELWNFSDPGQPVEKGDAIEYYTTVSNNGPDTATNIQIYQNYPVWLKCLYYWVSWDNGNTYIEQDPSYNPTTGYWTIPSLEANPAKNAQLVIYAIINQNGIVSNDAIKTHQNEYDPTEPDFAIVRFTVPSNEQPVIISPDNNTTVNNKTADVELTMELWNFSDPGQPVEKGDAIEYYTTVSNNGPDTATNIQIYQNYPVWLKCLYYWVSWDNGNTYIEQDPSYDPNTGFWTIPSLEANESKNAILVVYAIINQKGIVSNDAIKTHQNEYDPTEPDVSTIRFTVT